MISREIWTLQSAGTCMVDGGVCEATVNVLNIQTPKKVFVIALKFELCGPAIE